MKVGNIISRAHANAALREQRIGNHVVESNWLFKKFGESWLALSECAHSHQLVHFSQLAETLSIPGVCVGSSRAADNIKFSSSRVDVTQQNETHCCSGKVPVHPLAQNTSSTLPHLPLSGFRMRRMGDCYKQQLSRTVAPESEVRLNCSFVDDHMRKLLGVVRIMPDPQMRPNVLAFPVRSNHFVVCYPSNTCDPAELSSSCTPMTSYPARLKRSSRRLPIVEPDCRSLI